MTVGRDLRPDLRVRSSPSVSLEFENTATTPPTYELWIREFSGVNATGPKLATFSLSSGGLATGVNTFRPSGSSPLILQPNTTYGVVFDVLTQGSNSGNNFKIRHTASDAEDGGGAAGWTIDDGQSNRPWNMGPSFGVQGDAIEITITGHSYDPPPPAPTHFSQAHHELGDNYTQGETCGGKPNPQQEAFRQNPKAAFFGGGPYQTVYWRPDDRSMGGGAGLPRRASTTLATTNSSRLVRPDTTRTAAMTNRASSPSGVRTGPSRTSGLSERTGIQSPRCAEAGQLRARTTPRDALLASLRSEFAGLAG